MSPLTVKVPSVKINFGDYLVNQAQGELHRDRITPMNKLPEGWTDDMTIVVPTGRSLDDLVEYVLQSTVRKDTPTNIIQYLKKEFGLTQSDAELALDRTYGGVVRAATEQQKKLSC